MQITTKPTPIEIMTNVTNSCKKEHVTSYNLMHSNCICLYTVIQDIQLTKIKPCSF